MKQAMSTAGAVLMRAPLAPSGRKLWGHAVTLASILVFLFTLNSISVLLANYWLLESLDQTPVFWTNFKMGAWLYASALISYTAAAWIPAYLHPLKSRSWIMTPGFLIATIAAYFSALNYQQFLFAVQPIEFGKADPVFGIDIGWYVFELSAVWVVWKYALGAILVFIGSSLLCAYAVRDSSEPPAHLSRLSAFLGRMSSTPVRIGLSLLGVLGAIGVWLERYQLLLWDNGASSVHVGASAVDVTGFFSNLNYFYVTAILVLGITASLVMLLGRLNGAVRGEGEPRWASAGWMLIAFVAFDFSFKAAVQMRDMFAIEPNEPVVQLEYISRHINATRDAFGLNDIQEIDFLPNGQDAPLPSLEALLGNPTVRNAPLWPGFTVYLERLLDPQHADRILKTGDRMIYGPTLDIFQQEQKLRTYYRFMSVDPVRYELDGEKRMLVSAVRELPLYEPVPWLNYWGQRFMLYTHGWGVAMAMAGEVTPEGTPQFVSYNIPSKVEDPLLALKNERIYYGEGSETMAFSNVDRMKELDYPTDQDRAEIFLPENERTGVRVDSMLKRLVFGWLSGRVPEFLFSDLIKENTRLHYLRTPIERLEAAAPFLYYDSNPYAVVADGGLQWIVNAMTTSDAYPYSMRCELGDKSDERARFPREPRWVNYVEDSVKATVDASNGKVRFYTISNSPVIATWKSVYPTLFTDGAKMPEGVRKQVTYPLHLFHAQFDDLYIYYHMADPMYYFNLEDMWDDGDEVLGPVMDSGKAITFSIEPYPLILPTGGLLPKSDESTQYSLVMPFTPEKALNLRAIPIVYQDGKDYGKKMVLQIPKGTYVMGPEQADAVVEQVPEISKNLSWWNHLGMQVIRGHTTLLPVSHTGGNEVLYVEPIFLRSEQNPVSQLKKVAVTFRNKSAIGDNLADALRNVLALHRGETKSHVGDVGYAPETTHDSSMTTSARATENTDGAPTQAQSPETIGNP